MQPIMAAILDRACFKVPDMEPLAELLLALLVAITAINGRLIELSCMDWPEEDYPNYQGKVLRRVPYSLALRPWHGLGITKWLDTMSHGSRVKALKKRADLLFLMKEKIILEFRGPAMIRMDFLTKGASSQESLIVYLVLIVPQVCMM